MTIVNPDRAHKTQKHHVPSKILNIMRSATSYQTQAGNCDSTSCKKQNSKTSLSGCRSGITAVCVCKSIFCWHPDPHIVRRILSDTTATLAQQFPFPHILSKCLCNVPSPQHQFQEQNLVASLTYTAEKHGEVHDLDRPPSTLVIFILRAVTVRQRDIKTVEVVWGYWHSFAHMIEP